MMHVPRRFDRRAEATDDADRCLSSPTMRATRSAEPSPFWIVSTIPPGAKISRAALAASSTPLAFVAMMTSSAGPASRAVVVARNLATRSPLAPETRKPSRLIASICSAQRSTAQTSSPASAKRPA
jgi:hypothetical protein